MVQVGVREEHMVDAAHFVQRQVAHPRAGIDEDVVVDQERGGPAVFGNGPGAPQYANLHVMQSCLLSSLGFLSVQVAAIVLLGVELGGTVPIRLKG